MEIIPQENTSKRLVFEIKGAGHTVCNALKKELWNNKHVKVAAYSIRHPLVSLPKMIVETDGTVSPTSALNEAAEKLSSYSTEFRKELKKVK